MHGDDRMMQNFFLRPKGFNNAEGLSTLRWSSISRCYSSSNAMSVPHDERRRLLVADRGGVQLLRRLVRGRRMGRGGTLQEGVGRELGSRRGLRL